MTLLLYILGIYLFYLAAPPSEAFDWILIFLWPLTLVVFALNDLYRKWL